MNQNVSFRDAVLRDIADLEVSEIFKKAAAAAAAADADSETFYSDCEDCDSEDEDDLQLQVKFFKYKFVKALRSARAVCDVSDDWTVAALENERKRRIEAENECRRRSEEMEEKVATYLNENCN